MKYKIDIQPNHAEYSVPLASLAPSVAAVVTNAVEVWSEWTILSYGVEIGGRLYYVDNTWYYENEYGEYYLPVFPEDATSLVWNIGDDSYTATRQRIARNALGLVTTNDLAAAMSGAGTSPQTVTNIVRDLSLGGIWDSQLEVWWTPRMRNGSLTYEATTNVNLNAED